jgi:hypothetical protein
MSEPPTLKGRYQAASDAYREVVTRNSEQYLNGAHPTVEALQREFQALQDLEGLRRAYLYALIVPAWDA